MGTPGTLYPAPGLRDPRTFDFNPVVDVWTPRGGAGLARITQTIPAGYSAARTLAAITVANQFVPDPSAVFVKPPGW